MAKTWFEAAEKIGEEIEYHDYPMYVVAMAYLEQQKRTADALERIANMSEHATIKYVGGQVKQEEKK